MVEQTTIQDQVWYELIEHIENTKDFVLEQAPDIIQQALKYERFSASFNAGVMAILLAASLGTAYYFWKHPTLDKYDSRDFLSVFGVFIPLIAAVPFFAQLYISIDNLIKINIAPKYFLINLIIGLKK